MMLSILKKNNLAEEVRAMLLERRLVSNRESLIFTGSFGIRMQQEKPNYQKYVDGSSDIDLLVVISSKVQLELLDEQIVQGLSGNPSMIFNYSLQYGCGRNAVNIKYMLKECFDTIACYDRVKFVSIRKRSLKSNKPTALFYCANRKLPPRLFEYEEKKYDKNYMLKYDFTTHAGGEYYLCDIHAMLLFGLLYHDGACINDRLLLLKMNFEKDMLGKTLEDIRYLLRYFIDKGVIDDDYIEKRLVKPEHLGR